MSLLSVNSSLNTFSPSFDVPVFLAGEVAARTASSDRARALKMPGHQRQEPRVGARLEDHGVAAGLERARLLALERLVGGDLGERRRDRSG